MVFHFLLQAKKLIETGRCADKVCVDYRQVLVWKGVVWISLVLYEPRHYTLRLIHLDVAAMCSDGAQGLLLHLLRPLLFPKGLFCVCVKVVLQLLKAFSKILPHADGWPFAAVCICLSIRATRLVLSLWLGCQRLWVWRVDQHALWDSHKSQYWYASDFHEQVSGQKATLKVRILSWKYITCFS